MNTVLVTAYDINPYKGSESSTGWNFTLQAARFNNVVVITRKNNRENIERYINEHHIDTSNIEFNYYDLPYYLRFWKKGARGSSLYFYLWQMFMPLNIKRKKISFDIAHNVNFHADAFPTFLWILGKPTIWGPINHNEKIPKQYLTNRGEYLKDRLKWVIKNINWNIDPFMFLAKKKVDLIIGGNSSVQKRLNIPSNRFTILTQVASTQTTNLKQENDNIFHVLIIGRFIPIKSFDIALYAFENFYKNLSDTKRNQVRLSIIGEGPLEGSYKKTVSNFDSKNAIDFLGWVDKGLIDLYYKNSSVFVFPSHEGAGMVVVEALSHGLPVICFDNYGAGEFVDDTCAIKIPYSDREKSLYDFSQAMGTLFKDKQMYKQMSSKAQLHFEEKYNWSSKGLVLKKLYDNIST